MYCAKVIRGTTILFAVLSDYLVLIWFNYFPHPDTNKILFKIAQVFPTFEDCGSLMQRFLTVTGQPGTKPATVLRGAYQSNNNSARMIENRWKLAHNISRRFKKEPNVFVKIKWAHPGLPNNHEEACSDYNVSHEQKLQYLPNLFDYEPKQYYQEKIRSMCEAYKDVRGLLVAKYSNVNK